jgi:hypothetical protein
MKTKNNNKEKGYLFQKKNKVSIWISTHPYEGIPDEYFEETFFKNNTRAKNKWSDNFKIRYFVPEHLETNGAMEGTITIEKAVSACSYADSFIKNLMNKAKKKNITDITWMVLLYEYEYSVGVSGIAKDEYLTLIGAFDYDAAEEF